jgi:hypothetical protein
MTTAPIELISSRYDNAERLELTIGCASNPPLEQFAASLRQLQHSLGALSNDSIWRPVIAALRRYAFGLYAAPLPPGYLGEDQTTRLLDTVKRTITIAENAYPDILNYALETQESLVVLVGKRENPLIESLVQFVSKSGHANHAVILCDPRLVRPSVAVISDNRRLYRIRVLSASQMQSTTLFDSVSLVGALRWYPQSVVTSPCAPVIHLLQYRWLAVPWKPTPCFVAALSLSTDSRSKHRPMSELETPEPEGGSDSRQAILVQSLDELRPGVDWEAIRNRIRLSDEAGSKNAGEDVELVEAEVILLEDDFAVPLDADEAARVTVLDLHKRSGRALLTLRVTDLEPGMFLLTRTSGAGEYITEVADRELGAKAPGYRAAQKSWKTSLRKHVRSTGMTQTVSQLALAHASHANATNVRNWMSYRTIKPAAYDDFLAILHVVDLASEAEELWETMSMIDRAHRIAGHRIGKSLRALVERADLSMLERHGRMDFSLDAVEGGVLTAFRVVDINGGRITLSPHRLGHPVQVGDI